MMIHPPGAVALYLPKRIDMESIFSRPFFLIYRALWRLARPFLKKSKRLSDGWEERTGNIPVNTGPADIWIQAASGGEVRLALAVCQALPSARPLKIIIATWTRQGLEVVENTKDKVLAKHPGMEIVARFAPFDQPEIVLEALQCTRPSVVLLLETELWPGLMAACHELQIPVHVINGRINRSTVRFACLFSSLMEDISPRSIHAISETDRRSFASIFPCGASVMPNIKFSLASEAMHQPLKPRPSIFLPGVPIFLFASVRNSDETRLPGIFPSLFKAHPQTVIVVAPRHLHRVAVWQELLDDIGLSPLLWSNFSLGEQLPPGRVLIWDHFGELPQLYASAQAVYVGGAFGEGGQNFLEPLSAGRVPCIGPSAHNFNWALLKESPDKPTLEECGLLFIANSPKEVGRSMLAQIENPRDRGDVRKEFRTWLDSHLGGVSIATNVIRQSLER